jgi:hypothetical protein
MVISEVIFKVIQFWFRWTSHVDERILGRRDRNCKDSGSQRYAMFCDCPVSPSQLKEAYEEVLEHKSRLVGGKYFPYHEVNLNSLFWEKWESLNGFVQRSYALFHCMSTFRYYRHWATLFYQDNHCTCSFRFSSHQGTGVPTGDCYLRNF